MSKAKLPTASAVITEDFKATEPVKPAQAPSAPPVDVSTKMAKHVQFHAGVDQMGSSLSVTHKQADIYLELSGVLVVGKTDKNKGKKFFVPFTNIRGVTLL